MVTGSIETLKESSIPKPGMNSVPFDLMRLFDRLGVVSKKDIVSLSRFAEFVYPRICIAFLSYKSVGLQRVTYASIGRCLHKDSSTIHHIRNNMPDFDYFLRSSGISSKYIFRPQVVQSKLLSRVIVLNAIVNGDINNLRKILVDLYESTWRMKSENKCVQSNMWRRAINVEFCFLNRLLKEEEDETLGKIVQISRRISLEDMLEA